MTVSVVIPCHNAEPYLAQAVASALDQTRPPHEVIVLDDASTDGSLALARRLQAAAPERVQVFSETSGRASRTRNLGALAATGDAIVFLDADDVLAPDALAALVDALAREPGGIAACPWLRMELVNARWIMRPPSCTPRARGQDALSAWLTGWYYPPCSVLWSRAAFERVGRWDEQALTNDDGDLMMRALATGIPLVETSHGGACYRRLPDGQMSLSGRRFTREGLTDRLRVVSKIAYLLQQLGRLGPYRRSLAAAFSRIAADAREHHPDLWLEARACARGCSPSILHRAKRRLAWPSHQPRPAGRAVDGGDEVRWGVDRAQEMLHGGPWNGPPGPTRRIGRPPVSVIVPTYNRARLLGRAIDSVLAQTYGDFELLVVDDGSTDGTDAVVAGYADRRVRYVRQLRNAGVAAARNRGLREARGEFIAFLDSDDEWMPQKLARQVARFGELPDRVGLLYTGVQNENGQGAPAIRTPTHRGSLYRDLLVANVIHGTSGVMIRRSVVATAGFFDEGIPAIEDYDYWLRIARFFDIDFVEEPLIRYHEPAVPDRKSLDVQANLRARQWFYRKHVAEMRRAGVAHLFLLTSVRRALRAPRPDVWTARRLAAQAVREAPTSRMALAALGRTVLRV